LKTTCSLLTFEASAAPPPASTLVDSNSYPLCSIRRP
jgi:hypothetical protein